MALTQEEIRIKAGLDYSKVTTGLMDIRKQVFELSKGVPSMLTGMLRTNLVGFGLSIAAEILPTWKQIWNGIYGVDEHADKAVKESTDRLKKLRDDMDAKSRELAKVQEEINFKRSKDIEKIFLLETKRQELLKKEKKLLAGIAAEEKELARLRQFNFSGSPEFYPELRGRFERLAKSRTDAIGIRTDIVKNEDQQRTLQEGINEASKKLKPTDQAGFLARLGNLRRDYRNALATMDSEGVDRTKKQIYELINEWSAANPQNPRPDMPLKVEPAAPRVADPVSRWNEQVAARSRKWQGVIDAANNFEKPQEPAPQAEPGTPGAPPLRVKIVEID